MAEALTDDGSIRDDSLLWRRIPPWHFVYDENLARWRPSSAAFDNDPDGGPMSVVLAELLLASGRSPADSLSGHQGYALAALQAGLARSCGQAIVSDPLPDEPAHALVVGLKPRSVQRRLAKAADMGGISANELRQESDAATAEACIEPSKAGQRAAL